MSMSEDIKKRMAKKKGETASKDDLADLFNEVSYELIQDFMKDVQNKSIRLTDTTDLMRLFQIYQQINGIQEGASGEGQLPTISKTRANLLEEEIGVEHEVQDGEERAIVDLDNLEEMGSDEIEQLLNKRDVQKNKENENYGLEEEDIFG